MTIFDILFFVVALVAAFGAGAGAMTWWMERRHECMPHDPSRCTMGERLRAYAGNWVLIRNGKVAYSAPTVHEVGNHCRDNGLTGRIIFVPERLAETVP